MWVLVGWRFVGVAVVGVVVFAAMVVRHRVVMAGHRRRAREAAVALWDTREHRRWPPSDGGRREA